MRVSTLSYLTEEKDPLKNIALEFSEEVESEKEECQEPN